jgi:RimJ/RimL family protein N-acetyltransferase
VTTTFALSLAMVIGDDGLALRPTDAADEPFIRHLFKTARAESFAAVQLPPASLDALLEQQFRAQSAGYAAQFPDALSLVIARHDEPIGRLILGNDTLCWRIIDILLLPSVRGRGVGTDIIRAVAQAARAQGAHALTLAVLASNLAARKLYGRLGFVEDGEAAAGGTHIAMTMRLNA